MWSDACDSAGPIIREPQSSGTASASGGGGAAGMPKFINLKGVAAALPISNVDTGEAQRGVGLSMRRSVRATGHAFGLNSPSRTAHLMPVPFLSIL
eukprot:scaffold264446_cov33-Tisochrysis_lutea.AAC.5